MGKSCYYELLGVKPSATINQIKKAYREKAHKYHPDKNNCDSYVAKFQEINEAYKTLSNHEKRQVYDTLEENDYTAILESYEDNYEDLFNFKGIDELEYYTDIERLICDCPEWKKKRALYFINDPRRLCKHLIREFQVIELQQINLPELLKPFTSEILLNRYQGVGFTIYKELIRFKSSIVTINDDETVLNLYVKEHINPSCLFSKFYAYKDSSDSYVWADKKGDLSEVAFKSSDKKLQDAKEYLQDRFEIKNSDVVLCQSATEELLKDRINTYKAFEDGYLLSKLFEYSIPNYVINNNIEEAIKRKEKYKSLELQELSKYDTAANLLSEYETRFTPRSFNKKLVELGYQIKDKSLNNNDWILKGEGLKYGINCIYNSKYTHIKTPRWYLLSRFDFTDLSFKDEKRYGLKRMTRAMYKKDTFKKLLDLMNKHISSPKPKSIKAEEEMFVKLEKPSRSIFKIIKDTIMS